MSISRASCCQQTRPLDASIRLEDPTQGIATDLTLYDGYCRMTTLATRCELSMSRGITNVRGQTELAFPRVDVGLWFADDCEYMRDFDFDIKLNVPGGGCDTTTWLLDTLDDESEVHTTYAALDDLFSLLQKLTATPKNYSTVVPESTMSAFLECWRNQRLELVAHNIGLNRWVYHSRDLLMCHVMVFANDESARSISLRSRITSRLNDMLRSDYDEDIQVSVVSCQDYVHRKMALLRPLGGGGVRHNHTRGVVQFSAPPFGDPTWTFAVESYDRDNRETYAIDQLRDRRHVSFVARNEAGLLLGYVTCTLHKTPQNITPGETRGWWYNRHPTLRHFAQCNRPGNHYSILCIDGLHVAPDWRGGATSSLATLLVFHALHFAEASAAETGALRVACQSAARTTAVIMRQFGAVHLDADLAYEWMEERYEAKRSIKSDLLDFTLSYLEGPVDPVEHNRGVMPYLAAAKSDKDRLDEIRGTLHHRQLHQPLRNLQYIADLGVDTFLYIGVENTVFHTALASYRERLAQHATGLEVTEGPNPKRVKVGALSVPHAALGAFAVADL